MCDYSLHSVETRPAKVGDKLITRVFNCFHSRLLCARGCTRSSLCTSGDRTVFHRQVRRTRPWPWTRVSTTRPQFSVRSI